MADKVLRFPAVRDKLGISRSSIYDRLNPRSPRYDPTFPRLVRLGPTARAVGLLERELDDWLARQVERSRKGADDSPNTDYLHQRGLASGPGRCAGKVSP